MRRREFLRLLAIGFGASAIPSLAVANESVETLATEFRALRDRRRKLPPGTFDAATGSASGRLAAVMDQLGQHLGKPGTKRVRVIELMGAPDAIRTGPAMRPCLPARHRPGGAILHELADQSSTRFLVYCWRGWHDILFFAVVGNEVRAHGWWAALE